MEKRLKPILVNDFKDDTEGKQVFLKTEAIRNLSQHHPERDKKLSIPEQQHLHNLDNTNIAQNFRFGANEDITPNVTTSQNCPAYSQSVFQSASASEDEDDETEYQYITDKGL